MLTDGNLDNNNKNTKGGINLTQSGNETKKKKN
jgi:hypothetical protein